MNGQVTPAMQSIQRYMIVGMIMFGLVTFGVGGWATTTQLSGAVIAQGVVVVDSSVKKVQHSTGGIVGELRVREGARVNAGDILIRLDETQTLANATIVTNSLDELFARQARLEAERDGAEHAVFPKVLLDRAKESNSEASRAITAERKLFELRRQARGGQKAQLQEKSAQLENEIKGLTGQTEAKQKEVEFIRQELEGVRSLWQKNLVPITRLNSLERDSARLEGERSQLAGMIAQSKGKIAEIGLQTIQIDQDLRTEVGKDLIETRSKLSELSERKTAAVDQLNRVDIRAPQTGRVHELSVHTVGGVISPGEQIMLIVPDADSLAVEVKIAPRDIDQVYMGQTATMRFAAFNQKTTPEIDGEVSMVSADITQDQRAGTSYYTGRVLLKPEELAKLGAAKLLPGMPVEVFIKTAGRTALSYLLKPLHDQAERAFKER
ncbi:HlyD family type I secretion periplasmic adaptor subunit [Bradyrhizobium canariense]|uniref:HlyD family type I secretion periplasmic adaptor subunit n=1 Tax=Bradyrhizobium canariense TaxID=255045 RepID=UPI000A18E7FE|nr:HlyD family type I secretion periplasmic adaptor subunit [Bradyrhizobium canariense]OSI34761.1 hemolysin secretion protein D [Bradyrhizobium canariense]OSI38626.1 hemolysin secretion protein D [Bradyrhizobium canariense]OSI55278.1 hemolysin secretion protein D [Bradyrhizobium canariense]OSI56964.1 hemolysin secretion protein D [Bradyrhizobium canariense]OSI59778.1 hemolysin secretion protein D [Bradyrhizobium canariense]